MTAQQIEFEARTFWQISVELNRSMKRRGAQGMLAACLPACLRRVARPWPVAPGCPPGDGFDRQRKRRRTLVGICAVAKLFRIRARESRPNFRTVIARNSPPTVRPT